jgi:hypothetical protein
VTKPGFIPPMLATPLGAPFNDADWLFEVMWDGFRVEAVVDGDKVRLRTRGARGLEGIMAKDRRAPYLPGKRTDRWQIKIRPKQELVVGGWVKGTGKAVDLGALLVESTRTPRFAIRQDRRGFTNTSRPSSWRPSRRSPRPSPRSPRRRHEPRPATPSGCARCLLSGPS